MSLGIKNQVSVATESEYGTATAPALSIPITPSDGIVTEQDAVGVAAINTKPAEHKAFVKGVRNYNGAFSLAAFPNAIGYFMYSALGSVATSAVYGETEVYEHVFSEDADKPSLTVEQVIGSQEERYAGYIASEFNVEFSVGQPINITTSGMAKSVADEEKAATNFESLDPLKWTGVVTISIGGEDIKCEVESGNIEYTNGLNTFHGFCGDNAEPSAHYVENSNASGSFTMFLNDAEVYALRDKMRNQTELPILFSATGEAVGEASNTALQVNIPRAVLSTYTTSLGNSYNQVTVDFVGAEDATDGLIEVTLVNTYDSYEAA